MRKNTFIILIAILISGTAYSQGKPKRIKTKEAYIHKETNYIFPLEIEGLERSKIYSFNKKRTDIGITYENKDSKLTISVYLYPAGYATENRLRNEHYKSLQSIANYQDGVHATQNCIKYSEHNPNGIRAEVKNIEKYSSSTIYECGEWFLKLRITSEMKDSTISRELEDKFTKHFNPIKLVELSNLNPKVSVNFEKSAFADTIMLGSSMGSAYAKIDWVMENVDSLERASGFPGLQIGVHISGIKGFVNFQTEHPEINSPESIGTETQEYLHSLNSIIDNGFTEEFLMEQYGMLLVGPDSLVLDFDGYEKWKLSNTPIEIKVPYGIYFENEQ